MERCPGCSYLQGLLVIEKLGVDGVGVVVVEEEDVLVTAGREERESSYLVGVQFGGLGVDVDDGSEDVVGALLLFGMDVVEEILM